VPQKNPSSWNMHVEIFSILGCVVRPFSEMLGWNIAKKRKENLKLVY
jgi:hypothetical protein